MGLEIQKTIQELEEEHQNTYLTACNPALLDRLYVIELPPGFEFQESEDADRFPTFTLPRVYAEIDEVETEISMAENNNVQTLYYESLPTRITYGSQTVLWDEVIAATDIEDLSSVTPADMPIEGHLFITLTGNASWYTQHRDTRYFSKIKITGVDRLDQTAVEVIPLRYNGTFQTRTQWKSVTEVYASHLSSDATIVLSCLPFQESPVLNPRDIAVPAIGGEQLQFLRLDTLGVSDSMLVAESFINDDMDLVREGFNTKRVDYELELLDEDGNNVTISDFTQKPWSEYAYAIDDDYLYVYDYHLPFPDVAGLTDETADIRIGLFPEDDLWVYRRGQTATIHTRLLDLASVPVVNRWTLTYPDSTQYRVGLNGSLWPTTQEGWVSNDDEPEGVWAEQKLEIVLNQTGEYILEFEGKYRRDDNEVESRKTKILLYVPTIQPEVQLLLPAELRGCRNISLDSDNRLWFYNGTSLLLANVHLDYFITDYQRKEIWFNEQYDSVRVVP
jgi:hypothetical protein